MAFSILQIKNHGTMLKQLVVVSKLSSRRKCFNIRLGDLGLANGCSKLPLGALLRTVDEYIKADNSFDSSFVIYNCQWQDYQNQLQRILLNFVFLYLSISYQQTIINCVAYSKMFPLNRISSFFNGDETRRSPSITEH